MEAQITAGMKTPVLSCRPGPEGSAGDRGTKRDGGALSRTHIAERAEQVRPSSRSRQQLTDSSVRLSHVYFVIVQSQRDAANTL